MSDTIEDRIAQFKAQMQAAAEQLAFERAAQLRDQMRALEKEVYERRISQLLGGEGLPEPLVEPAREDYARTALVGYGTIASWEQLCRDDTIASFKTNRCCNALKLAQEAEAAGIKLSEPFTAQRLQERLHTLEAASEAASQAFKDKDRGLCIIYYNAWRIANK